MARLAEGQRPSKTTHAHAREILTLPAVDQLARYGTMLELDTRTSLENLTWFTAWRIAARARKRGRHV